MVTEREYEILSALGKEILGRPSPSQEKSFFFVVFLFINI